MEVDDAKDLIALARSSIESIFTESKLNLDDTARFCEKQGVFVTIKLYDRLRGCIGFPQPIYSLQRAIIEAARAAAFQDPRFQPLTKKEFEDLTIELSILTIPKLIAVKETEDYLDKIEIGKHGLIIKKYGHSGLLLPQVFSEYECTPIEALEMTCEKAGLDKDAWKKDSRIYSFSTEVFYEIEPYGDIVRG